MPKTRPIPPHLSFKSALAILPPKTLRPPFDKLREKHDRNFHRWPPHINLIYPFLARPSTLFDDAALHRDPWSSLTGHDSMSQPSTAVPTASIAERIRRVVQTNSITPIDLYARRPNHFLHHRRLATVWLHPEEQRAADSSPASSLPRAGNGNDPAAKPDCQACPRLCKLQSLLADEFAECGGTWAEADESEKREFVPHMSLGTAAGEEAARELEREVEREIWEFVHGEGRNGEAGRQRELEAGGSGWELHWKVDEVCVLERVGFHGRFKVVGTVSLGVVDEDGV